MELDRFLATVTTDWDTSAVVTPLGVPDLLTVNEVLRDKARLPDACRAGALQSYPVRRAGLSGVMLAARWRPRLRAVPGGGEPEQREEAVGVRKRLVSRRAARDPATRRCPGCGRGVRSTRRYYCRTCRWIRSLLV